MERKGHRIFNSAVSRILRCAALALLAAGVLAAAPLVDEPVPVLTLTDGTVLHEVLAKGFLSKAVLVKCQEGPRSVPYAKFPDEFQATLGARRQAAEAARAKSQVPPEALTTIPSSKSAVPAPTPAVPASQSAHQGCKVTLIENRGSVALLKFENASTAVVQLVPGDFTFTTSSGEEFTGVSWVGIQHKSLVEAAAWKNQREVEPGATLTLALQLSAKDGLPNGTVQSVSWK
jgi:hypothetical protein